MANHERGRSPSAGRIHNANNASTSPHPPYNPSYAVADNGIAPNHYSAAAAAFHDPTLFADSQYTAFQAQTPKLQQQASDLAAQGGDLNSYLQAQGFAAGQGNPSTSLDYSQGVAAHVSQNALISQAHPHASTAFPSFDFSQSDFSEDAPLDPAVLADLESQQSFADAAASIEPMATSMQPHSPTAPHLLPDMARRQSNSASPHQSPMFQPPNFGGRPRATSDTLDPASAMYPQSQAEWSNMGAYRTHHQRNASDQYSDYSSHSNQASPYVQAYETFEHSSPLLNPQQDPTFNDGLGLQQISLSEGQAQQTYHTPGHSPRLSPQLPPQQHGLPVYIGENNLGMVNDPFAQQSNGLDMFPGTGHEAFPQLNKPQSPTDFGQADQMSPPDITVDSTYAPPASNPNHMVHSNNDGEALSPPARTASRNRMRAKSDPYGGSRSPSPALSGRGRSPSLQPQVSNTDSLSPFDHSPSRSPSPRGRDKSANRARSSSHTSDQRDYILNLAEPERTPSNGVKDNGRVQKHPATFQCHLCPKRFTRAYNLRSHLRTHTDERPFVCTICGKAFARQHDRKRHEGLHSGEKKFVCKGTLQSGAQWGCGRRFARADALGRHFRSEVGRVCIKPLLDEEAEERQKAWMEEQQQAQVAAGLVAPQPMMAPPHPQMDVGTNFLPAVLLQQYPALAGIDWSSIPQGPPPEEDYSGRSSFEASSGGEYYDDMSENEMGSVYSDSQMSGMGMQQNMGMQSQGGAPQHQQQQQPYGVYGGQSAGDYLSDFEGR